MCAVREKNTLHTVWLLKAKQEMEKQKNKNKFKKNSRLFYSPGKNKWQTHSHLSLHFCLEIYENLYPDYMSLTSRTLRFSQAPQFLVWMQMSGRPFYPCPVLWGQSQYVVLMCKTTFLYVQFNKVLCLMQRRFGIVHVCEHVKNGYVREVVFGE